MNIYVKRFANAVILASVCLLASCGPALIGGDKNGVAYFVTVEFEG